ncbi:MAG: hypothetical protein CMH83_13365 [Nocardioides sp.]|nr:hypothetical protein [Nocardioides sp.]
MTSRTRPSGPITLWTGWIAFAAVMVFLVGAFHLVRGLTAVLSDDVFVTVPGAVLVLDVTAWGWVNTVWGLVLLVTGIAVLLGQAWARWVALGLVVTNMVVQLTLLPSAPLPATVTLIMETLVVWAILVHGEEVERL